MGPDAEMCTVTRAYSPSNETSVRDMALRAFHRRGQGPGTHADRRGLRSATACSKLAPAKLTPTIVRDLRMIICARLHGGSPDANVMRSDFTAVPAFRRRRAALSHAARPHTRRVVRRRQHHPDLISLNMLDRTCATPDSLKIVSCSNCS